MVDCSKVITVPQYVGSCWFNAVMMAIFYSQGIRTLLLKNMELWSNDKIKANKIMKDILEKNYTHINNEHLKFFEKFKPQVLLKELHKADPDLFEFNPAKGEGYFSGRYLYKLLNYLRVDNFLILDAIADHKRDRYNLYYGQYNVMKVNPKNINEKMYWTATKDEIKKQFSKNPDLLLIMTKRDSDIQYYPDYYYNFQTYFDPVIEYNGMKYVADSMIISNFNQNICKSGHEICGITCEKERYMYNGWMKRTIDKAKTEESSSKVFSDIPCSLMKHDWLDRDKKSFCIDLKNCDLSDYKDHKIEKKEVCFKYTVGPRNYIYIREDLLSKKKIAIKTKKMPEKTGEKLLGKTAEKTLEKTGEKLLEKTTKKVQTDKNCPSGKILNPKTNRCVNIDGKIGKSLVKN